MSSPVGPYTPVVRAGPFLICSGQLGLDGAVLAEGLTAQVHQAVANLARLLEGSGSSLSSVVKTTIFLTDMAGYAEMNSAYTAAFGNVRPARSAVAVAALPLGALVEIEAWALAG